jgi:hypothetical protein
MKPCFVHLFKIQPAIGMKLDISSSKKAGACLAVCRVAVIAAGMAGFIAGSQANDSLAGLPDPTQPPYSGTSGGIAVSRPTGPTLQSTFISASLRRAVISGKSYTVGDKFGGAVITEIQPYEVVMKRAGKESHLRLLPKLAKETIIVKVPANGKEGGKK